jgi:hypothetical protein
VGDDEKWWLEGLNDEQRARVENPVPLAYHYQPYADTTAYRPPATRKVAGWALGLSFVPCFCVPQLAAVVLATIALVRSRDGRDHGKGLAIAALCVVGAWILGSMAWVAYLTVDEIRNGDDRDDGAERDISVLALQAGDCFDMPENGEVKSVTVLSCDDLHDAEVYWTFDFAEGDYPGDQQLTADTVDRCGSRFDEFVGTAYEDSQLDVAYFFPTADLWRQGDRGVSCAVYEPTRPPSDEVNQIVGTLRNARR